MNKTIDFVDFFGGRARGKIEIKWRKLFSFFKEFSKKTRLRRTICTIDPFNKMQNHYTANL